MSPYESEEPLDILLLGRDMIHAERKFGRAKLKTQTFALGRRRTQRMSSRSSRGCERDNLRPRELFKVMADLGVIGTEFVAPLRDTMRFVHSDEPGADMFDDAKEARSAQALGCET